MNPSVLISLTGMAATIASFAISSAQASCSKNDSRLANCDTALGTAAYRHLEIERENCVITATLFQPTPTGEPSPVLSLIVAPSSPQLMVDGLPEGFKGTNFELTRTDSSNEATTGEFKVHLNAQVAGKSVSEELKCYY